MRRAAVVGLALLAMLGVPALAHGQDTAAAKVKPSGFGRLFPQLPAFTDPTPEQLVALAQTQLDPNLDSENNCLVTTLPFQECVFSGFTYFGQFVDHDITLDRSPQPSAPVDPLTLENGRTFALDLDSVYGGGPSVSPQLYVGNRFRLQEPNPNGVRDLPREPTAVDPRTGQPGEKAILVEGRNDENQIISQVHVAFLKAHNRLIDEGLSFADAQRTLQHHWQLAVVQDYLPHVIGGVEAAALFNKGRLKVKDKMTPVEFSVAAFRTAHSNVRRAYRPNGTNLCQNLQVFNLANMAASLTGGRNIQAGRQIDWGQWFADFPEPAGCEGLRNPQRKTDILMSSSVFQLPIPGAADDGSTILGLRNMLRGKFYGLPSGQAVAGALGLPVIPPAQITSLPGFEQGTPLWFYILYESSVAQDGQRVGPVGSAIVAATFKGILEDDPNSYRNAKSFVPRADIVGLDGRMSFADIVQFAGTVR